MEFYSVVENEKLLAEIVEFDNKELAVYWANCQKVVICKNMDFFLDYYYIGENGRVIKESVIEDDNDEEEEQLEIRNVIDKLRHRGI